MTGEVEQAILDIAEANAALGAAISTGELGEFSGLLREVQTELVAVTRTLADQDAGNDVVPSSSRLRIALERHGGVALPDDFAVLAGVSMGAGLLKLCRAVTRRAIRSVALSRPPAAGVREYLETLAKLLLVLAYRVELREQAIVPWGLCVTEDRTAVVGPTGWSC